MYDGEVDLLQDIVEEGKIYSFTAVDIKNALTQYKLVNFDIQYLLTYETNIEEKDNDNNIPVLSFKLRTFDKLHAFEGNKCPVIGRFMGFFTLFVIYFIIRSQFSIWFILQLCYYLSVDVMAMVREVGPVYYKQSGDKQIPKRDILLIDKT